MQLLRRRHDQIHAKTKANVWMVLPAISPLLCLVKHRIDRIDSIDSSSQHEPSSHPRRRHIFLRRLACVANTSSMLNRLERWCEGWYLNSCRKSGTERSVRKIHAWSSAAWNTLHIWMVPSTSAKSACLSVDGRSRCFTAVQVKPWHELFVLSMPGWKATAWLVCRAEVQCYDNAAISPLDLNRQRVATKSSGANGWKSQDMC